MRRELFHLTLLLSVLLFAQGYGLAQSAAAPQPPPPLVAQLPQGAVVVFRVKTTQLNRDARAARSESGLRLPLAPQVLAGEGNVIHRWLSDEKGNLVFGYDLRVEPLAGTHSFRVSARPLDPQFEARLSAAATGGVTAQGLRIESAAATLLRATEEQVVSDGETFALDVLVNEQLGLKVVDYIKVSREATGRPTPGYGPTPRDFALTNVELAVRNYQLSVDGEVLRTASARRSCRGSLIWFALPEGGRFIFSLVPHEGYDFRKLGVIENNRVAFTWKGKRYEWTSDGPIVGSGGVWNLWVLHDAAYVDPFAQPPSGVGPESKLAQILRDPLGTLSEPVGDGRRNGLQTKERRSAVTVRRVRVSIGGANSLGDLLPKN
ncbi:MAG TPA: hypothetical protein VF544_09175 [Pyrinomonadaceae bacterium]|jgi:hypothetical protein